MDSPTGGSTPNYEGSDTSDGDSEEREAPAMLGREMCSGFVNPCFESGSDHSFGDDIPEIEMDNTEEEEEEEDEIEEEGEYEAYIPQDEWKKISLREDESVPATPTSKPKEIIQHSGIKREMKGRESRWDRFVNGNIYLCGEKQEKMSPSIENSYHFGKSRRMNKESERNEGICNKQIQGGDCTLEEQSKFQETSIKLSMKTTKPVQEPGKMKEVHT